MTNDEGGKYRARKKSSRQTKIANCVRKQKVSTPKLRKYYVLRVQFALQQAMKAQSGSRGIV